MPKFHFNIRDGETLAEDPDGLILPNIDVARSEALHAAREILAEYILEGKVVDGQQFEICDDDGEVLETVPFKAAMRTH